MQLTKWKKLKYEQRILSIVNCRLSTMLNLTLTPYRLQRCLSRIPHFTITRNR